MLKISLSLFFLLSFVSIALSQKNADKPAKAEPEKSFAAEIELAKKAVAAHGGDKLTGMKSLIVRGSVGVTTSAIAQAIPATFVTIFAGEKYRIEINNPFQPIKQTYDGTNTSTTIRGGFTLPPINRIGFPILQQLGKQGFVITSLPDGKKKKGFRMTSPEGIATDFYLDEKTNEVKGYDSSYTIDGRTVTTSVEIDKCRLVEGVLVPEKYAQRFDTVQITVYADFKAKEILVNSAIEDAVFDSTE